MKPRIANPTAIPMMADSASGVSKHRSFAEGFGQALGDPEHAAELRHVLAEHQHPVVGRHGVVQRPVDRRHHGQVRGGWHRGEQWRFVRVVSVACRTLDYLRHVTPPSPFGHQLAALGLQRRSDLRIHRVEQFADVHVRRVDDRVAQFRAQPADRVSTRCSSRSVHTPRSVDSCGSAESDPRAPGRPRPAPGNGSVVRGGVRPQSVGDGFDQRRAAAAAGTLAASAITAWHASTSLPSTRTPGIP